MLLKNCFVLFTIYLKNLCLSIIDYLPMQCDGCKNMFCHEHLFHSRHNCPTAYLRDNQVPTCPLCRKPVPLGPGESADVKVSRHIDDDCQSDPAREHRGKIYKNRCTYKNCKCVCVWGGGMHAQFFLVVDCILLLLLLLLQDTRACALQLYAVSQKFLH